MAYKYETKNCKHCEYCVKTDEGLYCSHRKDNPKVTSGGWCIDRQEKVQNKKELLYDFSGYVTKYNVLCSDGRTIAPEAFMDCDGITVPLLSNLCEITIDNVIGSITLQHRSDGVYGYGQFNNSRLAKLYQEEVNLSCIRDLCIYANKLKEQDHIVTFGVIRAVSISSSGANPEAYIDCIINKDKEVQNE